MRDKHVENFRRIAQVTSCVAMVTANWLRVELYDFDAKWKTYSAITMFELTSCNFYVWETLILCDVSTKIADHQQDGIWKPRTVHAE